MYRLEGKNVFFIFTLINKKKKIKIIIIIIVAVNILFTLPKFGIVAKVSLKFLIMSSTL